MEAGLWAAFLFRFLLLSLCAGSSLLEHWQIFYSSVSQLFFPVSAVVVWGDGEQAYEIAVAECRCPA